jgi:hypothetical protein
VPPGGETSGNRGVLWRRERWQQQRSRVVRKASLLWSDRDALTASVKAIVEKATVETMGTESALTPPSPAEADFAQYLRPMTVIGRLPGVRRVPARVRTIGATAGSRAYWSGEKQSMPISSLALVGDVLEALRVASIVIETRELVRCASPQTELILRDDTARARGPRSTRRFAIRATVAPPA